MVSPTVVNGGMNLVTKQEFDNEYQKARATRVTYSLLYQCEKGVLYNVNEQESGYTVGRATSYQEALDLNRLMVHPHKTYHLAITGKGTYQLLVFGGRVGSL